MQLMLMFVGLMEMPRIEARQNIVYMAPVTAYCVASTSVCPDCGGPMHNERFPIKRVPGWDQIKRCNNPDCSSRIVV